MQVKPNGQKQSDESSRLLSFRGFGPRVNQGLSPRCCVDGALA
ncbi:hypothetical protein L537_3722 [Bordetella hinzii 1277]|nr:hypothetical protein L537_3722 [Bordetella hinzii 1277]